VVRASQLGRHHLAIKLWPVKAESAERAELRKDCDGNYPNVRRGEMWSHLINIQHLCFRRCDPLNRYIVTSGGISLLRNRGLAAKDILLDLAGGCFRQLGYEVNFLRTLEVRQMITSVIAKLQRQFAVTNRRSGRYGNTSGVSPSRSFRCTLRQKSG
jgi:hypothetical protein